MANRCTFAPLFATAISGSMENILMLSLTDGKHFVVQSKTFLVFHICGEAIFISFPTVSSSEMKKGKHLKK